MLSFSSEFSIILSEMSFFTFVFDSILISLLTGEHPIVILIKTQFASDSMYIYT